MLTIKEIIIVEGKYDKNVLSRIFDTVIIETSGFGIFNDRQKQSLLRMSAEKRGIIILTDADSSGFMIRNFIRGIVDNSLIKNAYVPAIKGKEKRKTKASAQGLLGVEGISEDIIRTAVLNAGATLVDSKQQAIQKDRLTKTDLYVLGLLGKDESSVKRKSISELLDIPSQISSSMFLDIINTLFCKSEFVEFLEKKIGDTIE